MAKGSGSTRRGLLAGSAAVVIGGTAAGAVSYRLWRDREPAGPPDTDGAGHLVWRNWSGIQSSYPSNRAAPANEDELASLLKSAPGPIRPVGAGHSFQPLVPTNGTLLTLDRMSGVLAHDPAALTAQVRAGTRLGDLGPALAAIGQEMPNLPDINKQSLGGALGTGTHGTGHGLKAIHGEVLSFRLATLGGDILDCSADHHPEIFNAARVNLGAFGVVFNSRKPPALSRRQSNHGFIKGRQLCGDLRRQIGNRLAKALKVQLQRTHSAVFNQPRVGCGQFDVIIRGIGGLIQRNQRAIDERINIAKASHRTPPFCTGYGSNL